EKGCAYAIVDEAKYAKTPQCILVEDTLTCLQDVARLYRRDLFIPFIGITGTNGKTTTKELVRSVLSMRFRTFATEGNLNNHIGVPLSILSIPANTEIAIIEMGANHPGEIAELCRLCLPTFGLITNIGTAHLAGFESFERIVETKTALYRFIERTNGKLFVNANDPLLLKQAAQAESFLYGSKANFYTQVEELSTESIYLHARLSGPSSAPNITEIATRLIGGFNLDNVAAAACVGRYFGLNDREIKQGIEGYVPHNLRSQIIQTKENIVVADAYNANPSSMQLSIESFFEMRTPHTKAFILGDMMELGKFAETEHQKIIDLLKEQRADSVFLIGPNFGKVSSPKTFKHFNDTQAFLKYLNDNPLHQHCLLVKGSRAMQLEKVIDVL
ncbi:MAG: UDP-N-acetylmuramoyl-tripeptide--D-alanyl-D-alanine ligase, partial [Bacteroidales bacterium]|nr:UDP-N-acetylmuramoyl-tripeptide--D-alanyl-D-alanine ligase [Bacteroidales bacterium]